MALDFYHGHGSPYSWRVWLALEFKGIPYNLKVLSFAEKDTTKPESALGNVMPPAISDYKKRIEALPYFDKTFPPHWR